MNFNNIINKHILYDGDHSYSQKMRSFSYFFVMTVPWHKPTFPTRFKIQGLSKAEMTFIGQFTCLNNIGINILIL
jgi:hypothetical protein